MDVKASVRMQTMTMKSHSYSKVRVCSVKYAFIPCFIWYWSKGGYL